MDPLYNIKMHAYMCQNIKLAGVLMTEISWLDISKLCNFGQLVQLSLLLLASLQNGNNYYNKFTDK